MRRRAGITLASELDADAKAVWARITDPVGINDELRPLIRAGAGIPRALLDALAASLGTRAALVPLGGDRCRVTDRVAWEPRPSLPGGLFRLLILTIFQHRHRRLRRALGGARDAPGGASQNLRRRGHP